MATIRSDGAAAAAVFAVGLALLLGLDPLSRPVGLDPATWDYMSISLLDGRIPYRDIFLHKTPLAAFVGGLGAATAALLGFSRLDGAHAMFIGLGAAAPALLFLLVSRESTRIAALAAAAWMLASDQWLVASIEGVRPKVATTAFGLACLLAAERRKPATAGAFGALATLCWQPGVVFLIAALQPLLTSSRSEVRSNVVRLVAGAAVPVAALLAFMASIGALGDMFNQAVGFNRHYIKLHARSPGDTVTHLYELLTEWNAVELLLLPVCVVTITLARNKRCIPPSLLLAECLYVGLMFINFQSWPDMILLAPLLGAIIGCGLVRLISQSFVAESSKRATIVVALVGAVAAASPDSGRARPPITFDEQAAFIADMTRGLRAEDAVLTVGYPELLIHTGRHSAWLWPYMWFGVDRFASQSTEGGFDAILRSLDDSPPTMMIVARRWSGPLRNRFEQWAQERYTRSEVQQYPHTVRPIFVYRRID